MGKKKFIALSIIMILIIVLLSILIINKKNKIEDNESAIFLEDKYYNKGEYIDASSSEIDNFIENKESFVVYTYNPYCTFKVSCDNIFENIMDKYNIGVLKIPFSDFKNTSLYNKVKYAPSIIIVSKGNIIAYLDANSDDDYDKYQVKKEFDKWLRKYVNIK